MPHPPRGGRPSRSAIVRAGHRQRPEKAADGVWPRVEVAVYVGTACSPIKGADLGPGRPRPKTPWGVVFSQLGGGKLLVWLALALIVLAIVVIVVFAIVGALAGH